MNELGNTIGQRVKKARERTGLTPTELASKAGVSASAISQLESEMTGEPKFSTGIRIAHALGVTPSFLAFGDESYSRPLESGETGSPWTPEQIASLQSLAGKAKRIEALAAKAPDILAQLEELAQPSVVESSSRSRKKRSRAG